MTTVHRWFRSGEYVLLGHLDLPQTTRGDKGALIVPPFGFEDVCSYRPLRFLGRNLAADGIPVLRFDLPGTGDSSGGARDGALLDAWVQSIAAAAAELRAQSGVKDVAVVGVHLGAVLALMGAARGYDVQDLVLWGPAGAGRTMLRELRAFAKMRRKECANGEPPQPVPGFEVAGFLLAPETQRTLEAVDVTALPRMKGRRILLLSRDNFPPDAMLLSALESAECTVAVKPGSGYTAMLADPHKALPPVATGRVISEFLTAESRADGQPAEVVTARTGLTQQPASLLIDGVRESVYTIGHAPASMFGVLSEPAVKVPRTGLCVLLLNAGAARHIGPNRMWVEMARRWAAEGVVSLRLDLLGIGESDGEPDSDVPTLYQVRLVEQIELAMGSLRARLGSPQFAAVGLCSGAFWAFHAAIRNPEIRAAVLLNPRLFFWDPEVDRRRLLRRTARGLGDWSDWRRLAQGLVPIEKLKRAAGISLDRVRFARTAAGKHLQIQPEAMRQAWTALERNQCRMSLIFTEGEPLLSEMEEEGQLPPETNPHIRCIRIANSDHTFSPLWAQKLVHEIIDRELDSVLQEDSARQPARER